MNEKEVLINFCKLKSKALAKILNIQNDFYWNKKDTKWLNSLSKDNCKVLLKDLKTKIAEMDKYSTGLLNNTCIPCLYKKLLSKKCYTFSECNHLCKECRYGNNCNFCNYGKEHGICDEKVYLSDWRYICRLFLEDKIDIEEKLNREFYQNLLNKAHEEN